VQDNYGKTAFHDVCQEVEDVDIAARKAHLLLQAGANPTIINKYQKAPVAYLECYYRNPNYHALIVLLEQYPDAQKDAEKASLLVTARRLVMAAARATPPSYLQGRVVCGLPLPRAALAPLRGG
jgi:hypothetical protein